MWRGACCAQKRSAALSDSDPDFSGAEVGGGSDESNADEDEDDADEDDERSAKWAAWKAARRAWRGARVPWLPQGAGNSVHDVVCQWSLVSMLSNKHI